MSSDLAGVAPPPKPRFRLSFGLGHLLTLMAGLGVGMAIMQPWKTWERPPAPVDYDVAVVRVKREVRSGKSEVRKELAAWFGPEGKGAGSEEGVELLGTSALSTVVGEAGVMEVTLPSVKQDDAAPNAAKPDQFKIELKPHSARGDIRTGVTASFSWLKASGNGAPQEQFLTQSSGATEVLEVAADGEGKERVYVVLTPQLADKRVFTIRESTHPAGKQN